MLFLSRKSETIFIDEGITTVGNCTGEDVVNYKRFALDSHSSDEEGIKQPQGVVVQRQTDHDQ